MSDFDTLHDHARTLLDADLSELVASGGQRDKALRLSALGVTLDARKQRLDLDAWKALMDLAREVGVEDRREALLAGRIVNETENRPALHTALRDPDRLEDVTLSKRIREARNLTSAFALKTEAPDFLDGNPIRRVVNIGIGGSDLGPRFVYDSMKEYRRNGVEARFVSNLDPLDLQDALEGADPATTFVCVTSKSFTTQETLMNATVARDWLASSLGEKGANMRFAAATAAPDKARAFGVNPENIFPFDEGVGGRYSIWSAAGLCMEIVLGAKVYSEFLNGARRMDDHFADAPLEENLPIAKALIDIWNRACLGRLARCVAAYSSRLEKLPAYLQQLEMESLGKSVARDGTPLASGHGGQLVWGGRGSDVQHSFFQWLHQGVDDCPVDFIALKSHATSSDDRAKALTANYLAQAAALLQGKDGEGDLAGHKTMPGGRMSSLILLDELTPSSLGALIALHEHKVFVEGTIYGLNPFDQWGVELGKQIAGRILKGETDSLDPSTQDTIARIGLKRV